MQEGGQIVQCEIEHFDIFKNIRSREGIISQQCYTTIININNKKKFNSLKLLAGMVFRRIHISNLDIFLSLLRVLEEGSTIRLVAKRERKFPNGHVKVRYCGLNRGCSLAGCGF